MGSWLPVGKGHAVDVMAVRVAFSDVLTDLAYRKFVGTVEDACFNSGLRSRHFAASQVVTMGPQGMALLGNEASYARVYNSVSSDEKNPAIASKVIEQVQIDQVSAIFRTWNYGGWELEYAKVTSILAPGLEAISGIVGLSAIRLEYANQFQMNDAVDAHSLRDVLKLESPWLSRKSTQFDDFWHCHTGAIVSDDAGKKALELVNVDRVDLPPSPGSTSPRRVLNILAGVEERSLSPSVSVEVAAPIDALAALPRLHVRVKRLVTEVLCDSMIETIQLHGAAK